MIRELFHIGSFSISPFGVTMVLAFFAAFWQLRKNMHRFGIGGEEDANVLILSAALGGIAGGKIYYTILNRDLGLLLERYGFVWYGGFILGALAVIWTLHRRKLPLARSADAAAPAAALGYAIGRVGCFLVGDDYGVPTNLPWGVKFPVGLPPTEAGFLRSTFGVSIPAEIPAGELLSVHPTQLYETGMCLGIWAVGLWVLHRFRQPGSVALLVFGLMAVERFAIEFLRAKDDRFLGPFTVAQALSVTLLVVILVLSSRRLSPAVQESSP